ncbi:MAG TPA: RES family NAD+ phosphorylase [Steroidobacteraceae bacterium]|nr:RES family NAD+ phosphorylase [Steroidobacteraceae bacterium]
MSSSTWTPHAVASEAAACTLDLWRAVEAQHKVATRALVDSLEEQEILETVLERSKPPIPADCSRYDYLLYTPFRYPPPAYGSRFRAYGDAGVWYGAEAIRTSCAEVGYWRWRFVADSRGLSRLDGVAHTIFQATAQGLAIDLRAGPFVGEGQIWRNPNDYSGCQAFARIARQAQTRIIRYASVRDPEHAGCAALLDCRAFASAGGARRRQTWFLTVDSERASWVRAGGRRAETHEFVFSSSAQGRIEQGMK